MKRFRWAFLALTITACGVPGNLDSWQPIFTPIKDGLSNPWPSEPTEYPEYPNYPGSPVSTAPSATPDTNPTGDPGQAPVPQPTLAPGEIGIKVDVNKAMWAASSYVLATNRNHVEEYFPNGAAKLEKIKELKPGWGTARYMYRIGHGPTDGRSDYDYMTGYHFENHWDKKGGYPYDDIRNALMEANNLDAEQLHVINYGTGTPEEAGRYVSYLNNPDDANRKSHPYPVQNARFFELGNEISWSMVRGHKEYASTDTIYAQRAKQFAQAMRKASRVPIQIGAVATTNSNWLGDGWSGNASTVKNILTTMGNDVDFLIYHGYPSWPMKKDGDYLSVMAQNEWNRQKLEKEILPAIKQHATHPVYIANTEFFTELYNDVAKARAMFGALYSADTLVLAFNHDIRIANQFCLDHGEQADASFFINNDPNKVTPIYNFQKMLAKHWGDEILQSNGQNIPEIKVQGADASVMMPKLAYSAARSKDAVYVMVVNRTNDSDITARIATGLAENQAGLWRLSGSKGWDSGEANISEESADVSRPISFPKSSVTILRIPR